MHITEQLLEGMKINPACKEQVVKYTNEYAEMYDMQSSLRLAHFLAQVCHESGGFNHLQEGLNYSSAERLKAVWPKRFADPAFAAKFVRNPEALANYVYANRNGNGDVNSGDGYKFRGRGPIQITGRANYKQISSKIFNDDTLLEEPDLLLDLKYGLQSAFVFWQLRNCNNCADKDSITDVTKLINGGTTNLEDRRNWYLLWKKRLAQAQD
jgi:putative chitinase